MSTEIKPGQVWRYGFMDVKVLRVDDGRVFYQYEPHSGSDGPGGKWDQPIEDFLGSSSLVKDTPAPLDPSKVKAGDTVTVRVEEFDIPDSYEVTGKAYVGPIGMAVGGFLLDGDRVTLTAHTPAPEPEPEWKPGTTGTATVMSGAAERASRTFRKAHGLVVGKGAFIEAAPGGYKVWSTDDWADFVPDEPRPLPTRDEVHDLIANGDDCCDTTDVVMALLRGETR